MKRFIVLIIIAYILGIIIGLYKLSCIVLFCIILFSSIYLIFLKKVNIFIKLNKQLIHILILLISLILGILHIKLYNNNWEKINNNLNGRDVKLQIINLEKETNYQKTFKAKILNGCNKNKKILLKVNNKQKIFKKIEIGNKIIANCKLQEIEVKRNTGGFDYKEYLKSKNIYGVMKFVDGNIIENKNISIYSLKNIILKKAYSNLKKDNADFMLALTIGYKASFDQEIKENLSKINLSHMIAISGMHISYLMLVLNFLFKDIKSKCKSILLISFLIIFNILIGDIPSVNRACITFILTLSSTFFYRKSEIYCNLALSSFIILLKNPYTIKDFGFIFSYMGTIGIIILYPIIKEKFEVFLITRNIFIFFQKVKNRFISIVIHNILNQIIEIFLVTISANILLLPLIIYNFNSVFLLFIFSNIIISPIFTICIIFSFFLILINFFPLKIFSIFFNIYSFIVDKIIFLTKLFSKMDFFNILICTPNIFAVIFIYIIIFTLIYFQKNEQIKFKFYNFINKNLKQKTKKFLSIKKVTTFLSIIVFIFIICNIVPKPLNIYFVDVGQGDCSLIVTPNNKKILIDGGGMESDSYDIGKKVLIPYLLDRGIKKLDYIIISHFDTDHVRRTTFCNK